MSDTCDKCNKPFVMERELANGVCDNCLMTLLDATDRLSPATRRLLIERPEAVEASVATNPQKILLLSITWQ